MNTAATVPVITSPNVARMSKPLHAVVHDNRRANYIDFNGEITSDFQRRKSFKTGTVVRNFHGVGKPIHYFETHNVRNRYIRNAATGVHYNCRVGTEDEDFFFSVLLSTGESAGKYPPLLFYDCPEEYERHMDIRLPETMKNRWREKYEKFMQNPHRKPRIAAADIVVN